MDKAAYDSLTPMERKCLRLAHHERKAEHIAYELGIAVSTVNSYIFSARQKLGGISRLSAADRIRCYEADQASVPIEPLPVECEANWQGLSTPRPPHSLSGQPLRVADIGPATAMRSGFAEVREQRAAFVFDDRHVVSGGQDQDGSDEGLRRIVMILAIAVLVALVLIASPAIYDSVAARVANSLERAHSK